MIQRLFVYGTLAPGRPNAHVLEDIPGQWQSGTVVGVLAPEGWGAAVGYPGLVLEPQDGSQRHEVEGFVLSSEALGGQWERLDAFEGDGYERRLTTARLADGTTVEVYVYALRSQS